VAQKAQGVVQVQECSSKKLWRLWAELKWGSWAPRQQVWVEVPGETCQGH